MLSEHILFYSLRSVGSHFSMTFCNFFSFFFCFVCSQETIEISGEGEKGREKFSNRIESSLEKEPRSRN